MPCWCLGWLVVRCRIRGLMTVPRATTRAVHRITVALATEEATRAKRRAAVPPAAAACPEGVMPEIRVMAAVPQAKRETREQTAEGRPAKRRAEPAENLEVAEWPEAAEWLEAAERLEAAAHGEERATAEIPASVVRPARAHRARRRRSARRFRPHVSTHRIAIG